MNAKWEDFDHPLIFLVAMGMALTGLYGVVTWGAKAAGYPGLAALIQHP